MTRDGQIDLPTGGLVAWREHGDPSGEPVFLLHGTPGSRYFLPDPSARTDSRVRLLTFDRPGYGRSTPLATPSLLGVAQIIERIVDDQGLERVAVVGFSGGGPYALACGALLPDRISRVAAVSTWGPIDEIDAAYASLTTAEQELVSTIRADPGAASALLWEHGQWFADTPLRFLETTPEAADEPTLTDPGVRANLTASNLEGAQQGQAGLVSDWIADALPWGFELAEISVPVDLWSGDRDPGRAPLDAPEIGRRIPSCTIHADPDAGHWLLISHWPEIVARAL